MDPEIFKSLVLSEVAAARWYPLNIYSYACKCHANKSSGLIRDKCYSLDVDSTIPAKYPSCENSEESSSSYDHWIFIVPKFFIRHLILKYSSDVYAICIHTIFFYSSKRKMIRYHSNETLNSLDSYWNKITSTCGNFLSNIIVIVIIIMIMLTFEFLIINLSALITKSLENIENTNQLENLENRIQFLETELNQTLAQGNQFETDKFFYPKQPENNLSVKPSEALSWKSLKKLNLKDLKLNLDLITLDDEITNLKYFNRERYDQIKNTLMEYEEKLEKGVIKFIELVKEVANKVDSELESFKTLGNISKDGHMQRNSIELVRNLDNESVSKTIDPSIFQGGPVIV